MATVKKELTKLTPQLMSYVEKCSMNTTIDPELYAKYNVKRGLRDVDGKGVVAGLTEIFQLPIFTQGRHCSFDDVMLDFSGYCFSSIPISIGFLCAYFIPKCIEFVRKKKAIADAIPAPAFKETLIEAEMGTEMPTDAKPPVKELFEELSPTEMMTASAEMVTTSAEMVTAPAEAKERATNKENYEN